MRLPRLLLLSAVSVPLAGGACKQNQTPDSPQTGTTAADDDTTANKPRRQRRKPGMPRPLRLPATSPMVAHVQHPGDVIAELRAYAPDLPAGHELLQQAVTAVGGGELETQLASAVDLERPWDMASVDGELIIHVPLVRSRLGTVAGLLASKPPVGKFGGVDLQRGGVPGPALAWLDAEAGTLTLASTERGLATGRELARQYGKQPLRLELEGDEVRKYAPAFALTSLKLTGEGGHNLSLRAEGVPAEAFEPLKDLEAGALTGLLESPAIAAGASSKYVHYARDVKKIMGDAKRQVDRQNFLVRGTLEDLLRRFGAVIRSWNGRVMVGAGPKNHLLVGLGADDPKKMGGAAFHFLRGVIDNLELARSIGVSVPKIRFQKNKSSAAGSSIAVVALERAGKQLPRELAPLINDRGDLRIAMAFPSRTGAAMLVVGPDCNRVMQQWLEATAKATPASDSEADFIAATVAVSPGAIKPLLEGGDPSALLGLNASREPTQITVVRDGDRVDVRVKGPKAAQQARRAGDRRAPGRVPPQGRAPRATPSRNPGKPVR